MSLFAGVKTEIDVKASIKDQSGKTIKVILKLNIKARHNSFFTFSELSNIYFNIQLNKAYYFMI